MSNSKLAILFLTAYILGLCTAVSVACFVTKSGWPLLALILMPSKIKFREDDNNESES